MSDWDALRAWLSGDGRRWTDWAKLGEIASDIADDVLRAFGISPTPARRQRLRREVDAAKYDIERSEEMVAARLEELRTELRAERISWGELAELQGLAEHIDPSDVELLEAAGVPEHEEEAADHGA